MMLIEVLDHLGFGAAFWKEERKVIMEGLIWEVGNGNTIRIWEDTWILNLLNFKVFTPKLEGSDIHKVKDLKDNETSMWNNDVIS